MEANGTLSNFESGWENTNTTLIKTIKISLHVCDVTVSTKKEMLSEAPLSYYLPVMVRNQILIKELWKHKLSELDYMSIPRSPEWRKISKIIFILWCLQNCIGLCSRCHIRWTLHPIFAKVKVASLENKLLPI